MPVTKEQIREIISDNNLNCVADVYSLLRDRKDICSIRARGGSGNYPPE